MTQQPVVRHEIGSSNDQPQNGVWCTTCKTGVYLKRTGRYGLFYGCSEYPKCKNTRQACEFCGGFIKGDNLDIEGTCVSCGNTWDYHQSYDYYGWILGCECDFIPDGS